MASPANIASQTRLPPHPEHQDAILAGTSSSEAGNWAHNNPPLVDQEDPHHDDHHHSSSLVVGSSPSTRRLCSVASYASFHAEALACSPTLNVTQSAASSNHNTTSSSAEHAAGPFSSLGAVAGTDGVAIFRVAQPHVPLLLLSHDAGAAATTTTRASITTSLRFSNRRQLASARGSGVLVWDVSGHSLSPLQGRLQGLDPAGDNNNSSSGSSSSLITSLTWKPSELADESWLAATTATSAGIWDLRSSSAAVRPSLRFGVVHPATIRNNRSIRWVFVGL